MAIPTPAQIRNTLATLRNSEIAPLGTMSLDVVAALLVMLVDGGIGSGGSSGGTLDTTELAKDTTSQAIRDRLPAALENGGIKISNNLAPSAGISGTKTIAQATTWEVLTTATALRNGVEVQSSPENTGLVFIRYVGSTNGIALTAGSSRYLPISNTNQVEVSVATANERVRWMGS